MQFPEVCVCVCVCACVRVCVRVRALARVPCVFVVLYHSMLAFEKVSSVWDRCQLLSSLQISWSRAGEFDASKPQDPDEPLLLTFKCVLPVSRAIPVFAALRALCTFLGERQKAAATERHEGPVARLFWGRGTPEGTDLHEDAGPAPHAAKQEL